MASDQAGYLSAFNHSMLYEVGPFWDPRDPDVIMGRMDTQQQRKKVGYVNIKADRGGETKYGIAKNANPDLDIRGLNLAQAMDVYEEKYWAKGKCDMLTYPITVMHFDACVNHGPARAAKMLQQAVGVEADGMIGPMTLQAVNSIPPAEMIMRLTQIRRDFFTAIVNRDQSQAVFIKGWFRRISEVSAYALSQV